MKSSVIYPCILFFVFVFFFFEIFGILNFFLIRLTVFSKTAPISCVSVARLSITIGHGDEVSRRDDKVRSRSWTSVDEKEVDFLRECDGFRVTSIKDPLPYFQEHFFKGRKNCLMPSDLPAQINREWSDEFAKSSQARNLIVELPVVLISLARWEQSRWEAVPVEFWKFYRIVQMLLRMSVQMLLLKIELPFCWWRQKK